MEWHTIIFKNIRRSIRNYLGYLLSSSLSVGVFCLFFIFILNPHVRALASFAAVAVVLVLCILIISWFSIFLIFYFHTSLLRIRNKEFGLFMTLGMTRRQIGSMIFLESLVIASIAMTLGIILGMVGSPLFLWAMGQILGLPDTVPFVFSPWAVGGTVIFFAPVFVIEALLAAWRIRRRTPRILLLGSRSQQHPPQASIIKVLIGVLCIAGAYYMAIVYSNMFIVNAIPIVVLVMIGTFLLYGQILVMVLNWFRRLPLHGRQLLLVSRLAYRLKDYSRALAIVTILSACVLTGMGAVYGFLESIRHVSLHSNPIDIQIVENLAEPGEFSLQDIRASLQKENLTFREEYTTTLMTGEANNIPVSIIALENYNHLRTLTQQIRPEMANDIPAIMPLSNDQAQIILPSDLTTLSFQEKPDIVLSEQGTFILQIGEIQQTLHAQKTSGPVFNISMGMPHLIVVVNDQLFDQLLNKVDKQALWEMLNIQLDSTQQLNQAVSIVENKISEQQFMAIWASIQTQTSLQLFSALLFAGCFVSILFLVAAGSSLYFKLFTQQEEDRRQFRALARLGLQKREAVVIIASEFFLLFFVPILIAAMHSSVATIDLIHFTRAPEQLIAIIWSALGVTCAIYVGCFAIYYIVALFNYFRRVQITSVAIPQ